jgi:hypothetical protein
MAPQTLDEHAIAAATRRMRWVWSIVAAVVIGSIAVIVWQAASRSVGMSVAVTSASTDALVPGIQGKWVLEISSVDPSGVARGIVLDKKTETAYQRETARVTVYSDAQTRIVMGSLADMRAGAVVHVTGTLRPDRGIDAEKIVILSGYVTVQDKSGGGQ